MDAFERFFVWIVDARRLASVLLRLGLVYVAVLILLLPAFLWLSR